MLKKSKFYHCLMLGKEIYRGSMRYFVASACTCLVAYSVKPLISPILIREIFDRLEDGRLSDFILLSCITCAILTALFAISYFLVVYADAWGIMLKNKGMINSLQKLYSIPRSRTDETYSQEEQYNRITQGCGSPNSSGAILANTAASGICAIVIMGLLLNISLLLSAAGILAVYEIFRVRYEVRKNTAQQEALQMAAASLNGSVYSMMTNSEQLLFSGMQGAAMEDFREKRNAYWKQKRKIVVFRGALALGSDLIYALVKPFIYGVFFFYSVGASIVGSLASMESLLEAFKGSFSRMIFFIEDLPGCLVEAERLHEMLEEGKKEPLKRQNDSFRPPDSQPTRRFPVIRAEHLYISAGKKELLKDVSFQIYHGEKVAFVGKNGSGKSTCLKALLGEFIPVRGTAEILGRPVTQLSHSFKETQIGYCPAESQLFYGTAEDNILMGASRPTVLFADGQMQQLMAQSTAQLSSGQKQRTNILRSLQKQPPVIFLDEPDAGLDPEMVNRYLDLVFSQAQTLLAVVHNRSQLYRFDKIVEIEQGTVRSVESYEEWSERQKSGGQ